MNNNENISQETTLKETPENMPKKAKTTRRTTKKQTGNSPETAKRPVRKTRTSKSVKDKKNEERVAEKDETTAITAETQTEDTVIAPQEQEQDTVKTAKEQTNLTEENAESGDNSSDNEQKKPETTAPKAEKNVHKNETQTQKVQQIPALPNIRINNIVELMQAPLRSIVLTDQQIQQLSLEEIEKRHRFLEETLANVLDYDVVISDTNIWLELLIGYTSNHSDPRYNARLQFERQLEFISKLTYYRGGRFMILGETYEEIDRFAAMQDPTNHRDADFTDNIVCLNTAARLAKRLILAQQRENRLRIDGIGAESHHASFADPAIIKKVAELFACGKKVLLMTNDASVAIRAIGICDDLQRSNNIPDDVWDDRYAPLRPMVFTFDDLKQLDFYTRQYHYIQMAAGMQWMQDIERKMQRNRPEPLILCQEAFRPGDKHRGDNLFIEQEKQQKPQQQKKQQQPKKQEQKNQEQKQEQKNNANTVTQEQANGNETQPKQKSQQRRKPLRKKATTEKTSENADANE